MSEDSNNKSWQTREAELKAELRIIKERQEQVRHTSIFASFFSCYKRYVNAETWGDFRAALATSNGGSGEEIWNSKGREGMSGTSTRDWVEPSKSWVSTSFQDQNVSGRGSRKKSTFVQSQETWEENEKYRFNTNPNTNVSRTTTTNNTELSRNTCIGIRFSHTLWYLERERSVVHVDGTFSWSFISFVRLFTKFVFKWSPTHTHTLKKNSRTDTVNFWNGYTIQRRKVLQWKVDWVKYYANSFEASSIMRKRNLKCPHLFRSLWKRWRY